MQIAIVTDDVSFWSFLETHPIIAADEYLKGTSHQTPSFRVINLCRSYAFQTVGYYVSLLAAAQDQKVTPSVQTIQDLNTSLLQQFLQDMDEDIQNCLKNKQKEEATIRIYFGSSPQKSYDSLAKKIYEMFPLPLLSLHLSKKDDKWIVNNLTTLMPEDVPAKEKNFLQIQALLYLQQKRFYAGPNVKESFFHLAILVEPGEEHPPSDQNALDKFAKAGESLGIQVDFIGKNDIKILPEYAGLFIRATANGQSLYLSIFTLCCARKI